MSVMTIEGVVDNGQIRLKTNIHLPDKIKVYVVVPDYQVERVAHIYSPRLAHPEQAADFTLEVGDEEGDGEQFRAAHAQLGGFYHNRKLT